MECERHETNIRMYIELMDTMKLRISLVRLFRNNTQMNSNIRSIASTHLYLFTFLIVLDTSSKKRGCENWDEECFWTMRTHCLCESRQPSWMRWKCSKAFKSNMCMFIWLDAYLRKCLFQLFRNDIEKGFSFEKGMVMGEGSGESLF